MSGIMQLLLSGRPQVASDPYFEYTTLLLPGNGTNGAQNNTFLDSSTNAFSITRNGNTTQGTFSPFSQTGWGNYFDGSGDSLQVADAAAMELGSGNWSIEMWVNTTNSTAYSALFTRDDGGTSSGSYVILLNGATANGIVSFWAADVNSFSTAVLTSGSVNCGDGTWHHIAVVRNSNTLTMYIDGTATSTASFSGSFGNTAQPLKIGSETGYSRDYTGYISNVRLVVGSAVYTSNFTPPTTPLTAITNTQLLTCQSNRFIDNSTNAFAITVNGNTSIEAFSPFNPTAAWSAATNGGSGYFDGSGDYLATPSNSALNLSGDFTVEAWVYPTSLVGARQIVTTRASAATATSTAWSLAFSGTSLIWFTTTTNISGGTAIANAWNYVAAVRSGSTITLYLNGSSVGTATLANNFTDQTLYVGACGNGNEPIVGYISGTRVLKGTAATITVPTAPPTAITNTSLLLNYTNAGIYDATSKNDLETVGNAQISTTQSKFGGSSMYFDGTGDYLAKYIADPQTIFGTGDFTFECWVYPTTLNSYNMILGYASPNQYWSIRNTGYLHFYDGTTTYEATTNAVLTNQWTHIAISRSGSTLRQFVNGVQALSSTCATSIGAASALWFGASAAYPSQHFFTGYINDLRVTKGVARYTANFTAPTAAFPLL